MRPKATPMTIEFARREGAKLTEAALEPVSNFRFLIPGASQESLGNAAGPSTPLGSNCVRIPRHQNRASREVSAKPTCKRRKLGDDIAALLNALRLYSFRCVKGCT